MKQILFSILITFSFAQYNFNLEDLNPSSEFYGQNIGPEDFSNEVRIVYFGYYYWGICTARFGELNEFYQQLISDGLGDKVKLFGIGKDSHINNIGNWTNANESMVMADSSPFSTWNDWDASQRDLFILDAYGELQYHQSISGGINNAVYSLINDLIS